MTYDIDELSFLACVISSPSRLQGNREAAYLRKYAIKKTIYAIKIERTRTDTQTKKAVQNNFLCKGITFLCRPPHL